MSREIKFRIWDNEKHEWLAESDDDALTYYGFHLVGEVMTVQSPRKWTVDGVVEQYTGLKDKNGKEIYEGDIVKGKMGAFEVEWRGSISGFCFKPKTDMGWYLSCNQGTANYMEVIGNIHENPELLEGAK